MRDALRHHDPWNAIRARPTPTPSVETGVSTKRVEPRETPRQPRRGIRIHWESKRLTAYLQPSRPKKTRWLNLTGQIVMSRREALRPAAGTKPQSRPCSRTRIEDRWRNAVRDWVGEDVSGISLRNGIGEPLGPNQETPGRSSLGGTSPGVVETTRMRQESISGTAVHQTPAGTRADRQPKRRLDHFDQAGAATLSSITHARSGRTTQIVRWVKPTRIGSCQS